MTLPIGGATATPETRRLDDEARLKKTAKQLEGVFVEQLFKAMRATVPQGEGTFDGGSGEEMFSSLMDQKLAAETPGQWSSHGLAEAAYRQLRKILPKDGGEQDKANDLSALRPGASAKPAPAMSLGPSSAAMPLRPQPAMSLSSAAPGAPPR